MPLQCSGRVSSGIKGRADSSRPEGYAIAFCLGRAGPNRVPPGRHGREASAIPHVDRGQRTALGREVLSGTIHDMGRFPGGKVVWRNRDCTRRCSRFQLAVTSVVLLRSRLGVLQVNRLSRQPHLVSALAGLDGSGEVPLLTLALRRYSLQRKTARTIGRSMECVCATFGPRPRSTLTCGSVAQDGRVTTHQSRYGICTRC